MDKTSRKGLIQVSRGGKLGGSELIEIPHLTRVPKIKNKHYVLKEGEWTDLQPLLSKLQSKVEEQLEEVKSQRTFLGLLALSEIPSMKIDGTYFIVKDSGKLKDGQTVSKGDTVYIHQGQFIVDPKPDDVLSNVHIDQSSYEEDVDLFLHYDAKSKVWKAVNQIGLKRMMGLSTLASTRLVSTELGGTGHSSIDQGHILVGDDQGHLKQVSLKEIAYTKPYDYVFASTLEDEHCVPMATTIIDVDDKTMIEPSSNEQGTVFKVLSLKQERSIELLGKKIKLKKNREYSFISFDGSWIQFKTQ